MRWLALALLVGCTAPARSVTVAVPRSQMSCVDVQTRWGRGAVCATTEARCRRMRLAVEEYGRHAGVSEVGPCTRVRLTPDP